MPESVKFDRAAHFYDETRGFPPGEEQPVAALMSYAGHLTPESRVLEIGIGTGRIALPLAQHVHSITGVDLSRPMLERLTSKRHDERIDSIEGDITQLPLADASFDAVVAVHIFHLVPNWQDALREVARVLKPGGPLLHAGSGQFHRPAWWNVWDEALARQGRQQNKGVQFRQDRTFLTESGWQAVGGEYDHAYQTPLSPNQMLDQLRRRIWSSTWDLTDEQLNAAVAELQAAMARENPDFDTPLNNETRFYVQAYLPPT